MTIRKAKIQDVPQIHKLINHFAQKNLMLPRALNELYEHLQNFVVCEIDKKIVGCCALYIGWKDLAEIKCLAVYEKYQNRGYGAKLVRYIHKEAEKLGVRRILVLTYVPEFFKKFGYKPIDKKRLPHKIWGECIKCPFFPNCNEESMIFNVK